MPCDVVETKFTKQIEQRIQKQKNIVHCKRNQNSYGWHWNESVFESRYFNPGGVFFRINDSDRGKKTLKAVESKFVERSNIRVNPWAGGRANHPPAARPSVFAWCNARVPIKIWLQVNNTLLLEPKLKKT